MGSGITSVQSASRGTPQKLRCEPCAAPRSPKNRNPPLVSEEEDWPKSKKDIRKLVNAVVFDKAGRKPLLQPTEELLFVETMGQAETSGFGRNRKNMGAAGRLLCKQLAATEGLGAEGTPP